MNTVKIFFCYSNEDRALLNQLEKHLSPLKRLRNVSIWAERDIQAGSAWEEGISRSIKDADILLLLVSADFMASDYCYSREMNEALKRHRQGTAHVIPILVRPVDISSSPLEDLKALPENGEALTVWKNQDEAFYIVAQGIKKVISELPLSPTQQRSEVVPTQKSELAHEIKDLSLSEQTGALVVYVDRALYGRNVDLYEGSYINGKLHSSASIIQRKIGKKNLFLAIFPSLSPAIYTVFADWNYNTKVYISVNKVTEIDWSIKDLLPKIPFHIDETSREEGHWTAAKIMLPKRWWQFWRK